MKSPVLDIFSQQVSGVKLLRLFEEMSMTITYEYIMEMDSFIRKWGYPPSFGEMLERLKSLTDDLVAKASLVLADYQKENGHRSAKLTKGCKRIIKTSINSYLKQVKHSIGNDKFDSLKHFELDFPG